PAESGSGAGVLATAPGPSSVPAPVTAPPPSTSPGVTPGCVRPLSALDIGQAMTRQQIGVGYRSADDPKSYPGTSLAVSGDKRIMIISFGCQGDYIDEIEREDKEISEGQYRPIRFTNEAAFVIVLFLKPPTAREAIVTKATVAALSGD
ncbi:MAG TPA: hypothetical protein VE985_03195, partial [Gaiellaceae bacterium]|nr:hypothetical protein [Gaiellaceae bacterium]